MTIGVRYATVANGEYGNSRVASSYGLPGSNLSAAHCRCDFGVKITVEDDLSTYCAVDGGNVRQTDIIGTSFPSYLWCKPYAWDATINDQNKGEWINTNGCFATFTMTKASSASGHAQYDFGNAGSSRGYYIGRLDNFTWESETSGTGYVWIGGSAIYDDSAITDPIYIAPQRIAIPGLRELLDYYPWAIRKGGAFNSCNRTGGSLKIRKSSSWRDCKNRESSDLSKSTAFVRRSGSWARAPKHGLNA